MDKPLLCKKIFLSFRQERYEASQKEPTLKPTRKTSLYRAWMNHPPCRTPLTWMSYPYGRMSFCHIDKRDVKHPNESSPWNLWSQLIQSLTSASTYHNYLYSEYCVYNTTIYMFRVSSFYQLQHNYLHSEPHLYLKVDTLY